MQYRGIKGISNGHEIDRLLGETAEGWKVSRMGKTDLTVLRLAVYEMEFDEDVPVGVAVNEAVELSKKFGGDGSPAFVNGILGKIGKMEAAEAGKAVKTEAEAAETGKAGTAE